MWHEVAIFEVSPDLVSNKTLNNLRDEGQIGDGVVISRFVRISITFLQNSMLILQPFVTPGGSSVEEMLYT